MSENNSSFRPGDLVFHPKCGFGTVQGAVRRQSIRLDLEPAAGSNKQSTEEFYEINLAQGGKLFVPVSRATNVKLRHLDYGLDKVQAELFSPAESLPANSGDRTAALRQRDEENDPCILARGVRDLLAYGHESKLTPAEKKWIDKTCKQLSKEVALVDHIPLPEAQEAVNAVVRKLSLH